MSIGSRISVEGNLGMVQLRQGNWVLVYVEETNTSHWLNLGE